MTKEWFLGVDWGSRLHALCLLDQTGHAVTQRMVRHELEDLESTVTAALAHAGAHATEVRVAIEVPRGALIDFFVERGFRVFAINPKQLDRCRDRYSPAGAKDDRRDARVLAETLRSTPSVFRAIRVDAPWLIEVRALSRLWEELEADVRRFANRLAEQLYRVAPALHALCPGADEPWLWAVLDAAPTAAARGRLSKARINRVLQRCHIRRLTSDAVLGALHAPAFPLAAGVAAAADRHIAALLPQIHAAATARQRCRADLQRALDAAEDAEAQREHRDVAILRSLPGLGKWTAATVLGEASEPLGARDYHRLRTLAGAAPVTQQSGKRRVVVMRRGCNHRLRQALYHWALASLRLDPATRTYYQQLRVRGIGHPTALRCVADRWLRILIAMLKSQTLYEPPSLPA